MKFLSSLGMALLLAVPAFAQDARESNSVRFKKEDRSGVIAEYDAPQSATEDALEQKLKAENLGKRRKESGYWKYESVTWPAVSGNKVDVYFDVSRHKGKSVVSMLVSPGNGNFVTSATDPQIVEGMKAFLMRFNADVIAWQQQLALNAQQKQVDEANSDLKRANRDTDRAARRQKKADREKERKEKDAQQAQDKLNQLKGSN